MFADLAGFTPFSETHAPREVVEMLNTYWAGVSRSSNARRARSSTSPATAS